MRRKSRRRVVRRKRLRVRRSRERFIGFECDGRPRYVERKRRHFAAGGLAAYIEDQDVEEERA